MQNLSDILPLLCPPIWPSHHVVAIQELRVLSFPAGIFQSDSWHFLLIMRKRYKNIACDVGHDLVQKVLVLCIYPM